MTSRDQWGHPEKLLALLAGWITLVDCSNNIRYAVKSRRTVLEPNNMEQLGMGKGLECIRQQVQRHAEDDSIFQPVKLVTDSVYLPALQADLSNLPGLFVYLLRPWIAA